MTIEIRNQANIPNKYERFIKWKIYKTKRKFDQLIYAHIFLTTEGRSAKNYKATIRLGVPGNDIILIHTSTDLAELWKDSFNDVHRYLRKNKEKQLSRKTKGMANTY